MEEVMEHSHLVEKESRTSPNGGKGLSPHNTHTVKVKTQRMKENLPPLSIRGTIISSISSVTNNWRRGDYYHYSSRTPLTH